MSKESSQQFSRLKRIKLLPRLTIFCAISSGIIIFIFISVFINLNKQDFNSWLNNSMFSSLEAIDNIYSSTKNKDYDIEYVWGKLMNDFEQLGLLDEELSTDDLDNLRQNLNSNIEKTIYAAFNYYIRNQRFQIKGFPFVLSETGEVMIHPTDEGKKYTDNLFFQNIISSNSSNGVINMQWPENRLGEKRMLYYNKNTEHGHIAFITLNENDYLNYLKQYRNKAILYGAAIFILINLAFLIILRPVVLRVNSHAGMTKQLFKEHKLPETKSFFVDELSKVTTELENGKEYLNQLTTFTKNLKEQNYNTQTLNGIKEYSLANNLSSLTEELVKIQVEEKKRKEELDTQNWIATGIAKFNDVLRKSSNLQEMGYDIVSNICDYMDINQAAIYNVERNENYGNIETIRLIAAYAFDRFRTVEKTLEPGEGLVGASIKETKSIYLDNIPDNYINITSGLGEAVPSHLLIIPLKKEEEILGALELASFHKFKEHEVKFLERLSQTFAISISSILVSDNTYKLLNETKEQAEQMASQEEEMRQTLEELQATQEEMQRKTKQMEEMNKQHEEKEEELEATISELRQVIDQKNQEIEKLKS